MRNIEKWLDMYMYKSYARLRSDYALARHWQVEPSRISQYRRGRLRLPLAQCLEIASVRGREIGDDGGDAGQQRERLEAER